MSEYTPDRWVIIELASPKMTVRKILSGNYGGYLGADTWRLSSGITEVIDNGEHWEIHNESGSVYHCYKNGEGFSNLMSAVFAGWAQQTHEECMSAINVSTKVSEHDDR